MLKSKRGISPILATLLLIVIAVAAIVVTYAWVITFTGSTTGQAGVLLDKDAVSWGSSPKNITIYVRNKGTSDAEINAVYIGTSSTNLLPQTSVTYDPSSKLVYANGGNILTITVTYSWVADTTYYFRIAPKTGTALEFSWPSPHS